MSQANSYLSELRIRSQVQPAADVVRAATTKRRPVGAHAGPHRHRRPPVPSPTSWSWTAIRCVISTCCATHARYLRMIFARVLAAKDEITP